MIFDAMCQHKRLDKTVLHIVTEVRMETQTRHIKAFETPVVVTPGLHSILVSIDQGPGRRSKTVPGLFLLLKNMLPAVGRRISQLAVSTYPEHAYTRWPEFG